MFKINKESKLKNVPKILLDQCPKKFSGYQYYDEPAIWASYENIPVGLINYGIDDFYKNVILWRIYNGYVIDFFKNKGVYTFMWNNLVDLARDNSVKKIVSATQIDNKPMINLMKKLGRKPVSINYEYEVK